MNKSNIASIIVLVLIAAGVVSYALWSRPSAPKEPATTSVASVPIEHPFGAVTKKTATELTLQVGGDKTLVVVLTPATEYKAGTSTKAAASDITVGTLVSITSGTANTDGSITATLIQIIPPPPPPKQQK